MLYRYVDRLPGAGGPSLMMGAGGVGTSRHAPMDSDDGFRPLSHYAPLGESPPASSFMINPAFFPPNQP